MSTKYKEIAISLTKRIQRGGFRNGNLPGEKALAEEFGVSYMTARRAVAEMIKEKTLTRADNGRLTVAHVVNQEKRVFALAIPSNMIRGTGEWIDVVERSVLDRGHQVRLVPYIDSDDPALLDVFTDAYAGVFLAVRPPLRTLVVDLIRKHADRIVTLFDAYPEFGTACLDNTPKGGVEALIHHMRDLGHKRVDCLNAQPVSPLVEQHLTSWESAVRDSDMRGELYDASGLPFALSEVRAYECSRKLLKKGSSTTAIFLTTVAAAYGVYRAAHERGIRIGKDLSVCAAGSQDRARLFVPSLTCLALPERRPLTEKAVDWLTNRAKRKTAPAFIPSRTSIFEGESCVRETHHE